VLGVTDPGVSPSEAFTSVHRQILEAVARGRARGALQADIAKALNIPNNNFFYQVTRLEARGLLKRAAVRPPATAQQPGDKKTPVRFSDPRFDPVLTRVCSLPQTSSNLLFLPVFADEYLANLAKARTGPGALPAPAAPPRLTAGGGAGGSDGEGDDDVAGGTGPALPNDDMAALRDVCGRLSGAAEHRAKESELKKALGYAGTAGHRAWRRVRDKLLRLGLAKVEAAIVGDKATKPVPIITLLRPFTDADAAAAAALGGGMRARAAGVNAPAPPPADDTTAAAAAAAAGPAGPFAADLSLEAQISDFIVAAGAQGVTQPEILARFGLMDGLERDNFARLEKRLKPCGVFVITARQQARSTAKVLVASTALRDRLGLPPLPPAGGAAGAGGASGGAAGGGGASAVVVPPPPEGAILSDAAALRRRVILEAANRDKMLPHAALRRLLQAALPAGAPSVDRKTADHAAAALLAEGLLRRWDIPQPIKGDPTRSLTHTVFVPIAEAETPTAEQKEAALVLVDAARRGPAEQKAAVGAPAAVPTLTVAKLGPPPGGAGGAGGGALAVTAPAAGVAGALEANARVQAARAREKRRTGYVRAKLRRAQHLHAWLCAALRPETAAAQGAGAATTASTAEPQAVEFCFQELVQRMPVDIAMQNLTHRHDLEDQADANDEDAPASATPAAATPAGGSVLLPPAFLARVEAAAIRGGAVGELSGEEQRRLLHPGTLSNLAEALRVLRTLGLLTFESEAADEAAAGGAALARYALAPAGRYETMQRDAAGAWAVQTHAFRSAADVAAYWAGLEASFAPSKAGGKEQADTAATTSSQRFPGTQLPMVAKRAQWTPGWLPAPQRVALAEHLAAKHAEWEAAGAATADDGDAVSAAATRLGVARERLVAELAEERKAFAAEVFRKTGVAPPAKTPKGGAGGAAAGAGGAKKRKATAEAVAAPKAKAPPAEKAPKPAKKAKTAPKPVAKTAAKAPAPAPAAVAPGEKLPVTVEELKAMAAAAALKATPPHAVAFAQGRAKAAAEAKAAEARAGGATGAAGPAAARAKPRPAAAPPPAAVTAVGGLGGLGGAAAPGDDDVADGGWDDVDEDDDGVGLGADAGAAGARWQRVVWRADDDRRLVEAVAEWRAAQPAALAAAPVTSWDRVPNLPAPAARCGPRWAALSRDASRCASLNRFLAAASERRRRVFAVAVANAAVTAAASAPPPLLAASAEEATAAGEAAQKAQAAHADAVEAADAALQRLSVAKAALVAALSEMHARPPVFSAAPKSLSVPATASTAADVAQLPVAAAQALLLLLMLSGPPPAPPALAPWAATAAASHAAVASRGPSRADIGAALRALGEDTVAVATAALQAAGHVSTALTLTASYYDCAAGTAGFPAGLGPAAAKAAADLLALSPGDEVAAFGPATPGAAAASPGEVAAALGLLAAGALALAVKQPCRGGVEALGAAACAGEAPRPEQLFGLCGYAARPADAPDEGGEGGGENEEETADAEPQPAPGRGAKRGAAAASGGGGGKKGRGQGKDAATATAQTTAPPADVEPEAALAAALTAWVAGAGAKLREVPLRAAAVAITAAGVSGVSLAALAASCFAGAAPAAAAAAACLEASGFAVSVSPPTEPDSAPDGVLVAASASGPYRLAAPGLAGGRGPPWAALAHALESVASARAVALALRHPGAPEAALAAAMTALPLGAATALLRRLAADGRLVAKTVAAPPQWAPPVKRRAGLPPPPEAAPQRHYFAGPLAVQFLS